MVPWVKRSVAAVISMDRRFLRSEGPSLQLNRWTDGHEYGQIVFLYIQPFGRWSDVLSVIRSTDGPLMMLRGYSLTRETDGILRVSMPTDRLGVLYTSPPSLERCKRVEEVLSRPWYRLADGASQRLHCLVGRAWQLRFEASRSCGRRSECDRRVQGLPRVAWSPL